jgi:hypothetical protein
MRTTPICLAECGELLVLDDNPEDRYLIAIERGTHLVVRAGVHAGSPGATFTHPAIAASEKQIYEYKHYRPNGGKYWTSRAGLTHYFVIPREAVTLLPVKGLSYIKATINGVPVTFNVSGGSGNGGWTDWLCTHTSIGVGHTIRDLKRFAAVAVRGTPLEPIPVETLTPEDQERWARKAAQACPTIKQRIYFLIATGQNPTIHLNTGYHYQESRSGPGVAVEYTWRKPKRPIRLVLDMGRRVLAKLNQIDWYATAQANGLALEGGASLPTEPERCAAAC